MTVDPPSLLQPRPGTPASWQVTSPMAVPPPPSRWKRVLLAIVTVLAWLPLVLVLAASGIAGAFGCALDESGPHPCVVLGQDVGDTLVVMFVMGWAAIFAFPFMVLTAVLWIVVAVRARRRRALA